MSLRDKSIATYDRERPQQTYTSGFLISHFPASGRLLTPRAFGLKAVPVLPLIRHPVTVAFVNSVFHGAILSCYEMKPA